MHKDNEYNILEILNDSPETVSQRDLAETADLSLGMTNAILKKLVVKGLLVMKRINSRNIRYALTPEGMAEVGRRSEALLKRTFRNVSRYRTAIVQMVVYLRSKGFTGIELQGESDLDFIVEWACMKYGLLFNPGHPDSRVVAYNQKELLARLENLITDQGRK